MSILGLKRVCLLVIKNRADNRKEIEQQIKNIVKKDVNPFQEKGVLK